MPAAPDATPSLLTPDAATRAVLRAAITVTVLVGILVTAIATALRGTNGLVAGALATVIVVAFFAVGQYLVGSILANNPQLALTGALAVYLGQIVVLFLLIALLKDATWLDPKVFAVCVVLCTIAWTTTAVVTVSRKKVLYVEPVSEQAGDAADEAPAVEQ